MASFLFCRICRVELGSPSTSSVPGRRTLLNGTSVIGNLTREIKYITPGADKVWIAKHSGVVPPFFSVCWPQEMLMLVSGIDYKFYGWDAMSGVRLFRVFPCPEHMANLHFQLSMWPTPKGGFSIADAHAIKVRGPQTS